MIEFIKWLENEAPEWVFLTAKFVFLSGIFSFLGFVVWAVINGYWVVPVMLPLIGALVVLHAYHRS